MDTRYVEKDKLLFVEITEDIDHHLVDILRRRIDNEITRCMPRKVVFDFDNVSFMDSAGIGMIIGRYKMANMIGGSLEMINVSKSVMKIFDMSRCI